MIYKSTCYVVTMSAMYNSLNCTCYVGSKNQLSDTSSDSDSDVVRKRQRQS
jgi:hypothetical protein